MSPGEPADSIRVLVCATCKGTIRFDGHGWVHTDPGRTCPRLIVAWPPALHADDA